LEVVADRNRALPPARIRRRSQQINKGTLFVKQVAQHRAVPKVRAGISRSSRTKMNASLAMVVCFVGFQGIVPQSWESAAAVTPHQLRAVGTSGFLNDSLVPTGRVGASLLMPYGLDAFGPAAENGSAWYGSGGDDAADVANGLSVTSVPGASGPVKRPAEGKLFAPLDVLVPTSSFGFRTSPITGQADEFHTGQDYAAPCGTPVYSADAGTVRAVGWHPYGGGNRVEVDHGNGLITSYNHLEAISVSVGETVNGGQPIATIGTTGSSTGCHLHFETILNGEHVDPLRWTLQPTDHAAPAGALRSYAPGAGNPSDIPSWAQSSTRSDQPAPASGADALTVGAAPAPQLPAGQDGAGTDTTGAAAPVTPPRTEREQGDEKKPDVPTPPAPGKPAPPAPPAPEKPAPPAPPAPEKPAPPAPPAPGKPVPPAPGKPAPPAPPAPGKPVPPEKPAPPEQPAPPAPSPTPTPMPTPVPAPTPVPEKTDPADSCDTDPGVPASVSGDDGAEGAEGAESTEGAAKAGSADAVPSAGVPAVAATPAVDPSVTSTTSDPAPCDDAEGSADPAGSPAKSAPADAVPGTDPSSDPAAVKGS
jgi:murein DD-endopeptidase MepM/ murein hydrolase activator NlpD